MNRHAVRWFVVAALAGCQQGSAGVESDAGATGGRGFGGSTGGTVGSTGGTGGMPVRVDLWEPGNCSMTSALRQAQSAPAAPPGPMPVPPPRYNDVPLPQPLRRLTRLEYVNTVRDLLGVEVTLPEGFPRDQSNESGFVSSGLLLPEDGRQLLETALTIAAAATEHLPQLLPPCCLPEPTGPVEQEACAATFIDVFGRRAFRRPLARSEGERLLALYRRQRESAPGFADALGAVIAAALQSPQFLYHRERGPFPPWRQGEVVRLTPYELASRLSYLFWASMPDQVLFDAAARKQLEYGSQLAEQAKRMLADPRSRAGIEDFHLQWLEVADLAEQATPATFSRELAQSMLAETREFVSRLFLDDKRAPSVEALLRSTDSFVDGRLAAHYGLPPVTGLQPVKLDPRQRSGLLTQASVLTRQGWGSDTNPVGRGAFVQRQFLCTDIPPPPNDVPPLPAGATARQRLAPHRANPNCSPCHDIIDPPGLALEHYDALGRYRDTEGGQPIDTGVVVKVQYPDDSHPVQDGIELAALLAKDGGQCMARQWLRYFLRRREPYQPGSVVELLTDASYRGQDVRAMLIQLTKTELFQYRVLDKGEVLP